MSDPKKVTLNDYLKAIGAAATGLFEDAKSAVGIDKETLTNARSLATKYQEDIANKKTTDSPEKWVDSDAAKATLEPMGDDTKREAAKAKFKERMSRDTTISAAITDGKTRFAEADSAMGGNLVPMLLGLLLPVLSMFGLADFVGGTIPALLIGGATFLVSGALMNEDSIGGQAWDWIKEKTGMGKTKAQRLAEEAGTGTPAEDKKVTLGVGQFKAGSTEIEPVADAAKLKTGDKVQVTYSEVDVGGTKMKPVREGTVKDDKGTIELSDAVKLYDPATKTIKETTTKLEKATVKVEGGKITISAKDDDAVKAKVAPPAATPDMTIPKVDFAKILTESPPVQPDADAKSMGLRGDAAKPAPGVSFP